CSLHELREFPGLPSRISSPSAEAASEECTRRQDRLARRVAHHLPREQKSPGCLRAVRRLRLEAPHPARRYLLAAAPCPVPTLPRRKLGAPEKDPRSQACRAMLLLLPDRLPNKEDCFPVAIQ